MKTEKIKGKKALSEIVAYVLLIVIAISLSLMVYAWLKGYVIKPTEECPDGVSLIIADYNCDSASKILNITLQNKGLFNIDGFIIKASNKTGKLPTLSLKERGLIKGDIIFFSGERGLEPNNQSTKNFLYTQHKEIFEIEIIPVKKVKGENLFCSKAVIRQELEGCN